ncbi:hypothetical protein [Sphingopyxis sp.]|uniref:hypothetical protein n=1 Tax=Sphingopyxis sp. TaxID=1908224 RepID=UPI003F719F00
MGNAELDEHLLAACDERWRKVAFVLSTALSTTGLDDKDWGGRALTKRLLVLGRKRQLDLAGNVYNWRASEVRLRPDRSE